MNLEEKAVLRYRVCQTCAGEKVISSPAFCKICNQTLPADNPWWENEETLLPCGHSEDNLFETISRCPECKGTGKSKQWVTLSDSEWLFHRYRLLIYAILGLAIYCLILGLLYYFLSVQGMTLICGSWWYGLILPALFVWQQAGKRPRT